MSLYYEDDAVRLYHGNCLAILPTLEPVDHVITDPPYSDYVHAKGRRGGSAHRGSVSQDRPLGFDALDGLQRAICAGEFQRLARRWVLVFSDVESCGDWRHDLVCRNMDYVRTGAWVKLGSTPQFTGDRPATGHEAITVCHQPSRKRWNGGGSHAVWTHPIVSAGSGHSERLHTTQKPLSLMVELVTLFTDEGETILDPFAGSGTTMVAAKLNGRKAIGIELSERYCQVAAERLSKTEPGRLFDGFKAKRQPLKFEDVK